MDARQLLAALTNDELYALYDAIPGEFHTRGLEPPTAIRELHSQVNARQDLDTGATVDVAAAATREASEAAKSVVAQLPGAFAAYRTVTTQLNDNRGRGEPVALATIETAAGELGDWLTEDKLAYLTKSQTSDRALRFTLVASPNATVNAAEIAAIAREFGKAQPHATYVWDQLLSLYSPELLSGTDPTNGSTVAFSLIPSKMDERLYGTVHQQREVLADMRAAMPALHVPSVLESVVYWQTLRSSEERLADSTAFDFTYMRHFDLPAQRIGDFRGIPSSCGGGGAGPSVSYSRVGVGGPARVAIGARAVPDSHPPE
jgi:hypothetical protein